MQLSDTAAAPREFRRDSLPPNTRLAEYRVQGVLGAGGFGITYLADEEKLGLQVAIKEYLPTDLAMRQADDLVVAKSNVDEEDFEWGRERFLDEARALARFDHPNIVRVQRFFEANSTSYIVMDYVNGEPLSGLLKRKRVLSESEVRRLVIPIADGLSQLHGVGLLHRDIKPGNIMIRQDGVPVLIDFGAARTETELHSRSLTSVVTPGYAPLEQYATNSTQTPATDIYALGAVLYRCVTGQAPVDAASRANEDTVVPATDAALEDCSKEFLVAIDHALRLKQEERPQDIRNFLIQSGHLPSGPTNVRLSNSAHVSVHPGQESQPSDTRAAKIRPAGSMLGRLWRGEYNLGKTFWLFGVLPFGLIGAISNVVAQETRSFNTIVYMSAVFGAYAVVVFVAVMRSCRRHKGWKGWRFLARVWCSLNVFGWILALLFMVVAIAFVPGILEDTASTDNGSAQSPPPEDNDFATALDAYAQGDFATAAIGIEKAAITGQPEAQYLLGALLLEGKGISKDEVNGARWLQRAANQGLADAQFSLGALYYYGGNESHRDTVQATKWLRQAAQQGHAEASLFLGRIFDEGDGLPEDNGQAVLWYHRAAVAGIADAQLFLGRMYEEGEGVVADELLAVEWYRKAADQGNSDAQLFLGSMYFEGKGAPQSLIQALAWFNLSGSQGNESARKAQEILMENMTVEQIRAAHDLSLQYAAMKERDISSDR